MCEFEMTGWRAMCRMVAGKGVAGRGIAADLLPQVPEVVPVGARHAGVVGAGLVDDGHPEAVGLCLPLACNVDVHAVGPAVAVGVELGLDPEVVADPGGRVGERGDDLGLAVLDDGAGLGGGRGGEGEGGERRQRDEGGGGGGRRGHEVFGQGVLVGVRIPLQDFARTRQFGHSGQVRLARQAFEYAMAVQFRPIR